MGREQKQKINDETRKQKRKLRVTFHATHVLFYTILGIAAILSTFGILYLRDHGKYNTEEQTANTITHLIVADTKVQEIYGNALNEEQKDLVEEPVEKQDDGIIRVVLDAGHGGIDGGSYYRDVIEKNINLEVTLYIEEILSDYDIELVLTRNEDVFLSLEDRAYIANQVNADLFISIHCNYYEGKQSVSGIECYYYPGSEEGLKCAQIISDKLKAENSFKVRSPKADDIYVLENTDMSAVLVELGFISDKTERQKLTRKDYQKLLATKISEGILASLEELAIQN